MKITVIGRDDKGNPYLHGVNADGLEQTRIFLEGWTEFLDYCRKYALVPYLAYQLPFPGVMNIPPGTGVKLQIAVYAPDYLEGR